MTYMKTTAMAALAALALAQAPAMAAYPERPITLIVPWGAGGGTDTLTRIFAKGLEAELGVRINVVNRTGGSGVTGHSAIANAKPDGYTIGAGTSELAATFKVTGLADLAAEDFTLISRMATLPASFVVGKNSPYANLREALDDIRVNPAGTYSSSGSGQGGPWHIAVSGLMLAEGLPSNQIKWIPSKGGAPALQDLAAGGVTFFTGALSEARALSDAGEVRILAIMSAARSPVFPDTPTVKEAAGTDWAYENWFSLVGPKGLPPEVAAKLSEAGARAAARPDVRDRLLERGYTPTWENPQAFALFVGEFSVTISRLLKELGMAKQ